MAAPRPKASLRRPSSAPNERTAKESSVAGLKMLHDRAIPTPRRGRASRNGRAKAEGKPSPPQLRPKRADREGKFGRGPEDASRSADSDTAARPGVTQWPRRGRRQAFAAPAPPQTSGPRRKVRSRA